MNLQIHSGVVRNIVPGDSVNPQSEMFSALGFVSLHFSDLKKPSEEDAAITSLKRAAGISRKMRLRWEFIKENKKVRKQENKNSTKKAIKKKKSTKKATKKKRKNFLIFLITFLVESVFSCFLTFLFSLINSNLSVRPTES